MSILRTLMAVCTVGSLIIPVNAGAQTAAPVPDELRKLVNAGDFQALETLLDQLQQDVLAERLSYTDQRDVYKVLSVLKPDRIEAVKLWQSQMPSSIHAQTLRARMLYALGWRMRGEESARLTYPDAMNGMRQLHHEAMEIAQVVFNKHPDFVPVSDTVMWLGQTVNYAPSVWDMMSGETPFTRIMRLTPNRGTLIDHLGTTRPQWGGHFGQAIDLCDAHALSVTDVEGYTSEICQIEVIYIYDFKSTELLEWAQTALDQTDHPILERARWIDAVRDRPTRAGARERRTKRIAALKYSDIRKAAEFDGYPGAATDTTNITALILEVKSKQALQELEHDPYNPTLLNMLMESGKYGVSRKSGPSLREMVDYGQRKLMFAPYNHRYWGNFAWALQNATSQGEVFSETAATDVEGYFRNAVVYSNYGPAALTDYLYHFYWEALGEMRINGSTRTRADGKYRDPDSFTQQELAQQNEQMICPFVVAERMLRTVCKGYTADFSCNRHLVGKTDIDRILEIATERQACEKELSAPLQDLLYTPVQFDWQKSRRQ